MKRKADTSPKGANTGRRPYYETRGFRIVAYITIGMLVLIIGAVVLRQFALLDELLNVPWPDIGPMPAYVSAEAPAPDDAVPEAPVSEPYPDAPPTPEPTPYIKPIPIRISFPRFDAASDIYPVGVTPEGNMDTVDSATDSAWFEPYPAPGENGNAIINGHVSFKGKRGTFSVLKQMAVGDEVVIEFEDGDIKYFEAVSNATYLIEEFPEEYLEPDGEPRLTLITCKGDYDSTIGTSRSRVVVICVEKDA